jgi:glycosyltransferase involved in cell wall biosynthesis
MLAAESNPQVPLVISVWGNDLTLHAQKTPWMRGLTRRALARADGLHADCNRDVRLARDWGLGDGFPTVVAPGSGGLDRSIFQPGEVKKGELKPELKARLDTISPDSPVVINPRGFRAYVRNDTFFQSIPYILREIPEVKFLAPSMKGEKAAEWWLAQLGIEESVILLPRLAPSEMGDMYRYSQVIVSPSEHDGTPNTFLEAIACGCFPVVGDLESLREWVQDGLNGLLIDPASPQALATAVVKSLQDHELRTQAAKHNQTLIEKRAERGLVGEKLDQFYRAIINQSLMFKTSAKGNPA